MASTVRPRRGRVPALVFACLAVLIVAVAGLVTVGRGSLPWGARGGAVNGTGGGATARPNVLLILADDMRFDGVWVMARLNELAARGITFNRAYATTPLCCPSRATILNGLYARNHGVRSNAPPLGGVERFDDRSTLATWVKAAGARTGLIGRYMNGYASTDVPPGWDYWFALWQVNEEYSNYFNYRVTDHTERRWFGSKPEEYSTRVLTEQALKFLEQDRERPFFLLLAPRTPHGPATPDPIDAGAFKDKELPLPPSYNEEDVRDKPRWIREFGRFGDKKEERLELFRRRQLESLLSLDRGIGTIVDALRADGRLDNTWIIFMSDNGLTIGEHRLDDGKLCPYEECVRVPLIVIPPGGGDGRSDDHLVANIDVAPTIAAILGATPGGPVDGRSLLPLIEDPTTAWRDALVIEQWTEQADKQFVGLVTADRKYVRYDNNDDEELYDLAGDPYELDSVHNHDRRAAEKARLSEQLETLLKTPSTPPPTARR